MQIRNKMFSFLSNFSSRPAIEILGLFIDYEVLKIIATNVDEHANVFSVNSQAIIDK